jgi:photosystem II stability/assembly factor-like uncharacterized protein
MKKLTALPIAAALLLAGGAAASGETVKSKSVPLGVETQEKKPDILENFKFRNLGPAIAGGRVSSVVGVAGKPGTYYIGAAGGGVFKTTDGGAHWNAIFTDQATSSIGAIAVAPSNPSLVWVGTGEANPRNDITDGRGVYLSSDGGHSWKFMGLADAGQISRIAVDPGNPDHVFVAVLGHAWGPNAERGVFRSNDRGKSWKKVLFVDDTTGCADLAMEPGNPLVLFAAMWQVRRYPWKLESGGPGSGLYRSTDGGETWTKLKKGLPDGPYGRIAVAVAPSNPKHVYALIEAKKGMLWESKDYGDEWTAVSDSHQLDVRPFYFSRMAVSPVDENQIFFLSFQIVESSDGGKHARNIGKGVHPDHHAIWIDPTDPSRMILGNDGGVYISDDGGHSWNFQDNIPIGQFYMVGTDRQTPFQVCGGLQDNNAWCGPSNSLSRAGITGGDWFVVAGGDGEYAVPAPSDPTIIYADSQNGSITRTDTKTHLSRYIRPYIPGVEDEKPSDLKYRFNWTSPIAVSATDADDVWLGGNVLFHSTDGGTHWTVSSPDLTRNDKSKQVLTGGDINLDVSGAETYDTILCITIAPSDPKVLWVGSDDGLVHVSRNGGQSWDDVTKAIPRAPAWARVYQIGMSPRDAGTAYVTFDAHMLDDRRAYAFKTTDYGKSWRSIAAGLPADTPVHVIREDPRVSGFLVAGTDTGLFYSHDGGEHWIPIKGEFPTVPVWDVKFAGDGGDLVVATHGRGLFVLDNIRPLEELTPAIAASEFHLFSPGRGTEFHFWNRSGFGSSGYSVPNPPTGVVLDYFLKSEIEVPKQMKKNQKTPVEISFEDSNGRHVATEYGPSKAGINRFVWDMRYDGPRELEFEKKPEESEFFNRNEGPRVLPGTYKATVKVGKSAASAEVTVEADPRLSLPAADLRAQTTAALKLRNEISAANEMLNRIDRMEKEIGAFKKTVEPARPGEPDLSAPYKAVLDRGKELEKKLKEMKEAVYDTDVQHDVIEDDIHHLTRLQSRLQGLGFALTYFYGQPPGEPVRQEMDTLGASLDAHIQTFNAFLADDVAAYDRLASEKGAPTIFAGPPVKVEPPPI